MDNKGDHQVRRTRGTGETPADVAAENERATPGNNRTGTFASEALLSYVERIERLTEEVDALSEDRKEVYSEAKGTGFDTKILHRVIALRKMDKADRQEQAALLDLYMEALEDAQKAAIQKSIDEGV